MSKFAAVIIVSVLVFVSCSVNTTSVDKLKENLADLKNNFAPDHRTAVFNYSININKKPVELSVETTEPEILSRLRSYLNKNKIQVKENFKLLPDEKLKDKIYGIVNLSTANLRTKPKHSAEMATQALLGTVVKVLKKNDGWLMVQTPDKYISWIEADAIAQINKQELKKYFTGKRIIYISDFGFSYETANKKSSRVSDLVAGDILQVKKELRHFYQVKYPDGREAFIPKSNCSEFTKWTKQFRVSAISVIDTAKAFTGIPYLWGGTSEKGFDCSGFTKTVYYLNRIILPRDASQQALVGTFVDSTVNLDKFQPGDLLFFGKRGRDIKSSKVVHVGIYVGNGKFIHASGMVKRNSLKKNDVDFNEYRYNTFLFARRILNSVGKKGVQTILSNKFYY